MSSGVRGWIHSSETVQARKQHVHQHDQGGLHITHVRWYNVGMITKF